MKKLLPGSSESRRVPQEWQTLSARSQREVISMPVRYFATCCLGIFVLTCGISTASAADDTWVCAYPGYLGDKKPVIVRFKIEGDDLVEQEQYGLRYKILQNNEFSIVAAWSISEIESSQNRTEPSIGAMVVL